MCKFTPPPSSCVIMMCHVRLNITIINETSLTKHHQRNISSKVIISIVVIAAIFRSTRTMMAAGVTASPAKLPASLTNAASSLRVSSHCPSAFPSSCQSSTVRYYCRRLHALVLWTGFWLYTNRKRAIAGRRFQFSLETASVCRCCR